MPGQDGFEALQTIHRRRPDVKVVVVTSSDSPVDADRARAAGATGFLSKHVDQGEIVAAIRAVCDGASWVQEGVQRPAALPAADGLPFGISMRELEVLRFVRNGFANAEIGRRLGITERTVKAHVKALCGKLGAADRAEAVARGFDTASSRPGNKETPATSRLPNKPGAEATGAVTPREHGAVEERSERRSVRDRRRNRTTTVGATKA